MNDRIVTVLALLGSAAAGLGAGVLLSQVAGSGAGRHDAESITGVRSGVDGSSDQPPAQRAVEQVVIEGVEGTEGTAPPPEPTIESVTTENGSLESIRGIKGIDSVALQNLEAVLRMQAPPPPPEQGGGGGGARAAAALLTRESDEPPPPEVEDDGREELIETDLKGS